MARLDSAPAHSARRATRCSQDAPAAGAALLRCSLGISNVVLAGVLAVAAASCGPNPQHDSKPAPEASDDRLIQAFLDTTCTTGATIRMEEELRARGARLTRLLIAAFNKGPAPDEIAATETAAGRRFDLLNRLPPPERQDGEWRQKRAAYLADAREDFIFSRKEAALAGLVILNRREATQFIESIASNDGSPFQESARGLLDHDQQ